MKRIEILVTTLFLITSCAWTSEPKGKCTNVKEENTDIYTEVLNCSYATKAEIIEALKDKRNENVTNVILMNADMENLPLSDVSETNLKDRLRYFAVINCPEGKPLSLDDDTFKGHNKMEVLHFENCDARLKSLKFMNSLCSLRRFEVINVTYRLEAHDHMVEKLPIEVLYVDRGQIPIYPADFLSNFPNLQNITIQYSQIETLQSGTFNSNQNAHTINLRGNLITKIPKDLFSEQRQLSNFDLSNNPMKDCVPLKIVEDNPSLEHFYIHGWPCSTLKRCMNEYKKSYIIECAEKQTDGHCASVVMKLNSDKDRVIKLTDNDKSYSETLGDTFEDDIACVSDKKLETLANYKRVFTQEN